MMELRVTAKPTLEFYKETKNIMNYVKSNVYVFSSKRIPTVLYVLQTVHKTYIEDI